LAALLLGAAALLLGLVAADALGRRLFPALPPWWAPVLLLSQGAWVAWHFNGMETGLQLALSLCAVLAVLQPQPGLVYLALGALAWTRPEGQVLAVPLAVAWSAGSPRLRTPKLGALLLLAASPSLLLAALQGSLVPDSMRPKSVALSAGRDLWEQVGASSAYAVAVIKGAWMGFWGGQDAVGQSGDLAALNPIGPVYPPLLLLAALFGFLQPRRSGERPLWLALAVALAALLALLSWQLPVGWHMHRYLAATSPLLWLGALAGLQALRSRPGLPRGAAAALMALWCAFGLASWPWQLQRCHEGCLLYAESNRNAALALRGLPPGGVAVGDAGLLAYYSGRPIVDLLGITDHRMAMAQAAGKGAVLEAMLARPQPPRWAALHEHRGDLELGAWLTLDLLKPLDRPEAGRGLRVYAWDWHGAARQHLPPLRADRTAGELNVADLEQESAAGYAAEGPRAGRTRALDSLAAQGRLQMPEGGREVLADGFDAPACDAVQLRAVFDRPGRLLLTAADGRVLAVSLVGPSPARSYSEIQVPVRVPEPARLRVEFRNEEGQPSAWTSCHYWFVKIPRP
jgi:hypothetical protein